MKKLILYFFVTVLLYSCGDEPIEKDNDYYFNYFPLEIGTQKIYEVTDITIDFLTNTNDTSVYYLRETVLDTIIDTLDYQLYLIEQEIRYDTVSYWEHFNQISVRKHHRSIVSVTENVAELSLPFPEKEYREWDINEFNNNEEEIWQYKKINTQDSVLGVWYDSVLVTQPKRNNSNVYFYVVKEAKYAYNVGLISQTLIDAESQQTDNPNINILDPVETRLTKGTLYFKKLVSYRIGK